MRKKISRNLLYQFFAAQWCHIVLNIAFDVAPESTMQLSCVLYRFSLGLGISLCVTNFILADKLPSERTGMPSYLVQRVFSILSSLSQMSIF